MMSAEKRRELADSVIGTSVRKTRTRYRVSMIKLDGSTSQRSTNDLVAAMSVFHVMKGEQALIVILVDRTAKKEIQRWERDGDPALPPQPAMDDALIAPFINDLRQLTPAQVKAAIKEAEDTINEEEPWLEALTAWERKYVPTIQGDKEFYTERNGANIDEQKT